MAGIDSFAAALVLCTADSCIVCKILTIRSPERVLIGTLCIVAANGAVRPASQGVTTFASCWITASGTHQAAANPCTAVKQ